MASRMQVPCLKYGLCVCMLMAVWNQAKSQLFEVLCNTNGRVETKNCVCRALSLLNGPKGILKLHKISLDSSKLVISTIVDKVYQTILRNQAKLVVTRKLWHLLLPNFWPLVPKSYFWKENWTLGLPPPIFEICLIFLNFSRL